eukprot:jgi/Tetstr1/463217/TSEL_008148.t1
MFDMMSDPKNSALGDKGPNHQTKCGSLAPEVLKVLKRYFRSSYYMIQFFKQPLIDNCDCKACELQIFKPLRMSPSVYNKLHTTMAMPLPIPKTVLVPDSDGGKEDREVGF